MGDVHDTSIKVAATRLLSVGLCGVLAPMRLSSFWPYEEASWWSQMPN